MNNVKDNQMLSKFREDHRGSITPSHHAVNHEKTEAAPIFLSLFREAIIKKYFMKKFQDFNWHLKNKFKLYDKSPHLF